MSLEIAVNKLYYSYPSPAPGVDPVPILRALDLEVARGETVALLGRVGAGKTTLCMALNGLVPHATGGVFRGDVNVAGFNTRQHEVSTIAQAVGLVFQDPESQLVQMRVDDEVAFGPENLGVPAAEIEERVEWALEAVGLGEYRERSPLLLSGGEKQRLAIAAMLAMQPRVLVLDEPTASLDPAGKAAVFRALRQLRRGREITIFIATQEMEQVARFADRVLVLHHGRIALQGSPAEVFTQVDRLHELGLGVPQLAELGHLLGRRTGSKYYFANSAEAFRRLGERARKLRLMKAPADYPPPPAPRIQPLADREQVVIENLEYCYEDGTQALRGVDLIVHPGDFLALLGPNGAGKTTLARHLNGLLRPTTGLVTVEGLDTRRTTVARMAWLVGYVFQNPDHQIFAPTVEEEIAFGLRMHELPSSLIAQRVAESLDRFRLARYARTPPALLGFGQRRQVALAAILAMQPKVLILDEPTGGLDRRSQQELMEIVAEANAQGKTIVLITHDMRLVAEYSIRAVVLVAGRVIFDGPTREMFGRREVLQKAQLVLPPVTRLAQRLAGKALPAGILTAGEFVHAWTARAEYVRSAGIGSKKDRRRGSRER